MCGPCACSQEVSKQGEAKLDVRSVVGLLDRCVKARVSGQESAVYIPCSSHPHLARPFEYVYSNLSPPIIGPLLYFLL